MSWWGGWFKGAFQGGALTNVDDGLQKTGPTPHRTTSNVVVTDERAMQISAVFACVRLLVNTGATLPMGFYERTTDGREPLPEDHQLAQLLKYSPNNFMSAKQFRSALFTQRVLWGNGYAKIKWMGDRPVSLTPLKPEYMTVERGKTGLIYLYTNKTGTKTYKQRDIFHLKGFGDGITGLSALGYAREVLGISVASDSTAANSIGGNPSAVLELDDIPTDAQKDKLREMYGAGNVTSAYQSDGGLQIIPGGMKYRSISIPPDDMQLLESRQFQVPEIARFFGVPAVMIDGSAGAAAAWPASYEQQVLSFLTFGLKPYLEEWEDVVVNSLLVGTDKQRIFAEHKVDGLLRTDSAGRSAFYSQMTQNGIMTRNEARVKENMPRVEGADDLTVQVNMTPLQDLPTVQGTNNA
jgi:HK97 family phage portal protein